MNITRRNALTSAAAATVLASAPHTAAATILNGPDARLEDLYRAWREAEDAYGVACTIEDEASRRVPFQGVEVEDPDGKVHTCETESEVTRLFPTPFALTDFSDADLAVFSVAARGRLTKAKHRIMAEIWSRYPDVHADAREAALDRLEEAERAHRRSPDEIKACKRAEKMRAAAEDRVEAILGTIAGTPAVTLQGVLTKLRIWADNDGDGFSPADAVRDSAHADLRRLVGEVSS